MVEEVIERVRHENPAAYFKGMLSLVQKDVSVEGPDQPDAGTKRTFVGDGCFC